MNVSPRIGSILMTFALAIVGCDPAEPPAEPPKHSEESQDPKQGPPSPPPPIDPSPVPQLPSTSKAERDAAAKQDEAKAAEKPKDEPKLQKP